MVEEDLRDEERNAIGLVVSVEVIVLYSANFESKGLDTQGDAARGTRKYSALAWPGELNGGWCEEPDVDRTRLTSSPSCPAMNSGKGVR